MAWSKSLLLVADSGTVVVRATALSQQSCLKYEHTGGKEFNRPENPDKFFDLQESQGAPEFAPIMSEQFRLPFASEAQAHVAQDALPGLRLADRPVMLARAEGNEVFAGCTIVERVPSDSMIVNSDGVARQFYELFYNCNLVKRMHHPDGILWISTTTEFTLSKRKISLRTVAPALFSLLGYSPPNFMELPPLSMSTSLM